MGSYMIAVRKGLTLKSTDECSDGTVLMIAWECQLTFGLSTLLTDSPVAAVPQLGLQ